MVTAIPSASAAGAKAPTVEAAPSVAPNNLDSWANTLTKCKELIGKAPEATQPSGCSGTPLIRAAELYRKSREPLGLGSWKELGWLGLSVGGSYCERVCWALLQEPQGAAPQQLGLCAILREHPLQLSDFRDYMRRRAVLATGVLYDWALEWRLGSEAAKPYVQKLGSEILEGLAKEPAASGLARFGSYLWAAGWPQVRYLAARCTFTAVTQAYLSLRTEGSWRRRLAHWARNTGSEVLRTTGVLAAELLITAAAAMIIPGKWAIRAGSAGEACIYLALQLRRFMRGVRNKGAAEAPRQQAALQAAG